MSRRLLTPAAWLAALVLLAFTMPQSARSEGAKRPAAAPAAVPDAPPVAPARASSRVDGVEDHNCLGGENALSCQRIFHTVRRNPHVIAVPQPVNDQERAAAEARDRRWVERCRPVIRQDAYGVPRYQYAAPGCEYGRLD